jgi:hypothetical protein
VIRNSATELTLQSTEPVHGPIDALMGRPVAHVRSWDVPRCDDELGYGVKSSTAAHCVDQDLLERGDRQRANERAGGENVG